MIVYAGLKRAPTVNTLLILRKGSWDESTSGERQLAISKINLFSYVKTQIERIDCNRIFMSIHESTG
jgi:hypothetical protein